MQSQTFISKLANEIILNYETSISDVVIILPNKRAKVFLIEAFINQIEKTIFSPEITSIEEFVQEISGIRSIDNIELLFEFYNVYLSITDSHKQEPFETFANWAKTLLQDFNEIDRYLLEPNKVLKYLENIKEIEHWSVQKNKTKLIEKHLAFWKLLPEYYEALYSHLISLQVGYQGLIYREAVANLNFFSDRIGTKKYIFAGFNALNQAEEKIIQHLLALSSAQVYWDVDAVFLNDSYHDAGLFVRKFKADWSYYKSHAFNWIANDYQQKKNIHIIGTPKAIGQAKIVGSVIDAICNENENASLKNVAVVLGDEDLLIPVLYALPASVDALNITMGYSSKNNPAQILIAKLFKMHTGALKRNAGSYVFYYKDILDILNHPLIEPIANAQKVVNLLNVNNFTFITHKKFFELCDSDSYLLQLLFQKWTTSTTDVLESISSILIYLKSTLGENNDDEKITKAFVFSIFKVINKLQSYYAINSAVQGIDTLQAVYKQIIDVAEVSFEGEPLNGLQIMGVLESRVLDFETVIITSVNEGTFPAGKSTNSFIPYDVKRELGLPTFKEKDAIYTYHFYHLLQRAKNIYLLYNTDSDGFDSGEKSRFITQLLVEKQESHNITEQIYNPDVPNIATFTTVVPKSDKVIARLLEICTVSGMSPTALTAYMRNPLQFYFQRILRISEVDEVEENIALSTLGTIIHKTLEVLYLPFVNKNILTTHDIDTCITQIDSTVLKQFKEIYKEGDIKSGQNLLTFEVAKRNIFNFLNSELQSIRSGDQIKILGLELECSKTIEHESLPHPVTLKGTVDRIEMRNGKIRIIDYKTGKVEKNNVTLQTWDKITSTIKNDKIIQILAYAFMYQSQAKNCEIEAGIISFKNLKSGFLPFTFKVGKIETTIITDEILDNYCAQIVLLLNEILDQNLPFKENS